MLGDQFICLLDWLTMFDSRARRLCTAKCKATKLLEHAVSIVILGPLKSKNQLTRFDSIELVVPVVLYLSAISGSESRSLR